MMNINSLILRNANRKDASDLAILEDLASHGLATWLWQREVDAGRAETALAWGRSEMLEPSGPVSYLNAVIAETDNEVCGMALGYPIASDLADAIFETDVDVLVPIYRLFSQARGNWLIDSIASFPQFRGYGVGNKLLGDQFERARAANVAAVSIVVEDGNLPAIALYKKHGFVVVSSENYVPFKAGSTTKEYQLMNAQL